MKLYAVRINSTIPECEVAILVRENGRSTNRFADGIVGVPHNWKREAEMFFDPRADECVGEE